MLFLVSGGLRGLGSGVGKAWLSAQEEGHSRFLLITAITL
jgi:hypothetical protein